MKESYVTSYVVVNEKIEGNLASRPSTSMSFS